MNVCPQCGIGRSSLDSPCLICGYKPEEHKGAKIDAQYGGAPASTRGRSIRGFIRAGILFGALGAGLLLSQYWNQPRSPDAGSDLSVGNPDNARRDDQPETKDSVRKPDIEGNDDSNDHYLTNSRPALTTHIMRMVNAMPVVNGSGAPIVIHHSASRFGNMASFAQYYREKHQRPNGSPYDFAIGNGRGMRDGDIGIGNRWRQRVREVRMNHTRSGEQAISICVIGNFAEDKPTRAQMLSLHALVEHLSRRFSITPEDILMHREVKASASGCPGINFPAEEFKRQISISLRENEASVRRPMKVSSNGYVVLRH